MIKIIFLMWLLRAGKYFIFTRSVCQTMRGALFTFEDYVTPIMEVTLWRFLFIGAPISFP